VKHDNATQFSRTRQKQKVFHSDRILSMSTQKLSWPLRASRRCFHVALRYTNSFQVLELHCISKYNEWGYTVYISCGLQLMLFNIVTTNPLLESGKVLQEIHIRVHLQEVPYKVPKSAVGRSSPSAQNRKLNQCIA